MEKTEFPWLMSNVIGRVPMLLLMSKNADDAADNTDDDDNDDTDNADNTYTDNADNDVK